MIVDHFDAPGEDAMVRAVDALFDSIFSVAARVMRARRTSLMLLDEQRGALTIARAQGLEPDVVSRTLVPVGDGIAGRVVATKRPLLVQDLQQVRDLPKPRANGSATPYFTDSFVSVPILVEDDAQGVINVTDKITGEEFSNEDLVTLELLSRHIGTCITIDRLERAVMHQAEYDALTGLHNRAYFERGLERELARARRYGHVVSLLMVDLDQFKRINDTCGHQVGDQVLARVGQALAATTRRPDIVARYGGDEFVIVLVQTGIDGAQAAAQRALQAVESCVLPVEARQAVGRLSASIGISAYPTWASGQDSLVDQADRALYLAKQNRAVRIATWGEHATWQRLDIEGLSESEAAAAALRMGSAYLAHPSEALVPAVAGVIPMEFARRHRCVPLGAEMGTLTVAMVDPTDGEAIHAMSEMTGLAIYPVLSSNREIERALSQLERFQHVRDTTGP